MSNLPASPELPDLDLDRLEALARAATPGPWAGPIVKRGDGGWTYDAVDAAAGEEVLGERGADDSDLALIAAANPAAVLALIALARRAQPEGEAPQAEPASFTVWYGPMPESNGKSNFTAILMRKGGKVWDGITLDRSEYPDRVRYEADRVRHLLGELPEPPFILDYDADKHSGYTAPAAQQAERGAPAGGTNWNEVIDLIADELEAKSNLNEISQFTALCEEFDRRGAALAAKAEAPAHETIVQQADELVCTACGTSAQQAAAAGSLELTERDILDAAENAGLWPNTIHHWIPALQRYTRNILERHAPSAPGTPEAPTHCDPAEGFCAACREQESAGNAEAPPEPFMYAISTPSGKAYFDEHCVDTDPGVLQEEVAIMNQLHGVEYRVVPVYTRAAQLDGVQGEGGKA